MKGFSFNFRRKSSFLYPGQEIRPHQAGRKKAVDVMVDGSVRQSVEVGRVRLLATAGLFAFAYLAIAVRLFDVMILKGVDEDAERRPSAKAVFHGRADIVDRNGLVLATNLPTVNLYANTNQILDVEEAVTKLRTVFPERDAQELRTKLAPGHNFIYLDRNLTPRVQAAVNALGIPGLYFEDSQRRAYLQANLAAHVLGATDPDNNGVAGMERAFDQQLRSSPEPLKLTLDVRIQSVVRDRLKEGIEHFEAIGGAGLVMDVQTGEILALVSLPDYDPERIGASTPDALFNKATLGVYEMGSTFKLFNTALALDSGLIRVGDVYDTTKPVHIARFTIKDAHPEPHPLNVAEILVHSSNIGSARMAMVVGPERQQAFLKKLGLLKPPEIELPEIGKPMFPAQWRDVSTMTISFGHGIAVTSVNLATGVSAMINGGYLHKPTLVMGPRPDPVQVISPETSRQMRHLMRMVVTEGTAKKADIPGYLVGAKTGTAEKVSARGGYDHSNLRTTFASAFPMDNPRYVVLVVLDEPKPLKSTYGFATSGWNAAPTGGKIIAEIGPLLGVFPRPDVVMPNVFGRMPAGTNSGGSIVESR